MSASVPFFPTEAFLFHFRRVSLGNLLRVFAQEDIDSKKFEVRHMKGLKRTERRLGKTLGHRRGTTGKVLLGYHEARWQIYLPTYYWVLKNCLTEELESLSRLSQNRDLVFLDYETHAEVEDLSRPLSHASLVRAFIENQWPQP